MTLTIKLELGNDAMQTWADIMLSLSRAYEARAEELVLVAERGRFLDANGNTVGEWKVTR